MNNHSLIKLAEEFPDLIVQVRLGDLLEANRQLIADTKLAMEQDIADSKASKAETFVSRKETMSILGKTSTTLWRWKKDNYLVPIPMGGMDMYRMSDIRRLVEGDNTPQEGATS